MSHKQNQTGKQMMEFCDRYSIPRSYRGHVLSVLGSCERMDSATVDARRMNRAQFVANVGKLRNRTRWSFNECVVMIVLFCDGEIERLELPDAWEMAFLDITNVLYSAGYDWHAFTSAPAFTTEREFDEIVPSASGYTFYRDNRDKPHKHTTFRVTSKVNRPARRPFWFDVSARCQYSTVKLSTAIIDRFRVATDYETL